MVRARRQIGKGGRVVVMTGDGELQEGQIRNRCIAIRAQSITEVVGVSIYAAGVIAMLAFSTAYNFAKARTARCCAGSTTPASS